MITQKSTSDPLQGDTPPTRHLVKEHFLRQKQHYRILGDIGLRMGN
jgi:hypothetical protein